MGGKGEDAAPTYNFHTWFKASHTMCKAVNWRGPVWGWEVLGMAENGIAPTSNLHVWFEASHSRQVMETRVCMGGGEAQGDKNGAPCCLHFSHLIQGEPQQHVLAK